MPQIPSINSVRQRVNFEQHLRSLPQKSIKTILERRPEAALALDRMRAPGYRELSAILANAYSIDLAIHSLDRFHRQVLDLACLSEGLLTEKRSDDEGLSASALAAAAIELAKWALAFPEGEGKRSAAALAVPDCVVAANRNPGGLGIRAEGLLESWSVDVLRAIAANLGLADTTPPQPKARLINAIVRALTTSDIARRLVASAPPTAARALAAIRESGGALRRYALYDIVGSSNVGTPGDWRWTRGGPNDGLAWLESRGLVCPAVDTSGSPALVIPAEVEYALRGRAFPVWTSVPPVIEPVKVVARRAPHDALADMDDLLALWEVDPPPALQRGGLGTRELRKAAKSLRCDEGLIGLLFALAAETGLLGQRKVKTEPAPPARSSRGREAWPKEQFVVTTTPDARAWQQQSAHERWFSLVRAWLGSVLLDEMLAPGEGAPASASQPQRNRVLARLGECDPGTGASPEELAAFLDWKYPSFFGGGRALTFLTTFGRILHWLGLGASDPIGLNDAGRLAIAASRTGRAPAALKQHFAAPEQHLTLQADFRIIVPGVPSPELAGTLGRFATQTAARPARIYELSEASIRRALDGGMTGSGILEFLGERSTSGVPSTARALIEDIAARHGTLVVGKAQYFVRSDDPALIASIAASKKLRTTLEPRAISPLVAVVRARSEAQVLQLLRAAGFMPVSEDAAGTPGSDNPGAPSVKSEGRVTRFMPPRRAPAEKDRSALARALAQTITSAKDEPAPEPTQAQGEEVRTLTKIATLLAESARKGIAVEIEYRAARTQAPTRRVIEPHLVYGGSFSGFCRLRQDERTFSIRGVSWARATSEVFAPKVPSYARQPAVAQTTSLFDGDVDDPSLDDLLDALEYDE